MKINDNEKNNVKIKWLVTVILYGTIPKILLKHKKIKVVYITNINEYFFMKIESFRILVTNKKVAKTIVCILFVTNIGRKL